MAIVTFTSTNRLAEASALAEVLRAYLDEQPQQPVVQGAKAHLEYDDSGNLKAVVVTVEPD